MKKEIKSHPFVYLFFALIIILGFFVRTYRVGEILGFYFDQGRDALVIWDLWHKGKFFLVGPTTGIAGIFRGPFYYYLIAPFYLFGQGNPVWPAVFLALLSILAIILVYYLGFRIQDRVTGLMAAIIACFSFNLVMASRWLSNPTPMLLLSVILVWAMIEITKGRKAGWPIIALVSGLSLFNFGSSGELFYFPVLLIFLIWQWKNRPSKKYLIWSVALFLLTFLPLVLFDLRHGGILRQNINKFLIGEQSFGAPTWRFAWERLEFYFDVFGNKIFHGIYEKEKIILGTIFFAFAYSLSNLWKKDEVKIIILLLISPMLGLIFFQGNFGNVYDYYLTGYYLIFVLLFAITLGYLWRSGLGKVFVVFFFYLFLTSNLSVIRYKVTAGSDGPETIVLGNQKRAIDWIYKDAEGKTFNIDVYVPPVIPYAYDYLFRWYGFTRYGYEPESEHVELLYTLYEIDSPHPDRLETWLERQKGIGEVEKEARFGGITVQRRKRF